MLKSIGVLACSGLLFAWVSHAADGGFGLDLDPTGISTAEMTSLESFLSSTEQLLPDGMKEAIGRRISVRFSAMDKSAPASRLAVPACAGVPDTLAASDHAEKDLQQAKMQVVGHDNAGGKSSVVDLNTLFKADIVDGPEQSRTYPCGHHTMYSLAQATLVHELAHVYDAGLGKSRSTKNVYFQKLMGFTKQWTWSAFLFRSLMAKNHLMYRSPDPYEFKNIKEAFAVNMEYFVLDPEFGCRRPTVDHYFRQLMNISAAPTCTMDTKLFANSENSAMNLKLPVDLDPKRIYDIHFLLAGKGDALMSNWGHAMYRLIICAPSRKTVGPECLQDVQYHLTISFRANMEELVLSYWKGLMGDYPSQLFLLPMPEIINEYNKEQLRDLISLPLNLTDDEKSEFVYRVLEQYWEYQGRYYFLTNNCAQEATNFLQGVVPDSKIQKLHDLTPIGLEDDLSSSGMIDSSLVKDQSAANQQGYFFASKRPVLDSAFAKIQTAVPGGLAVSNSNDYMQHTTAAKRLDDFNAAMKAFSGSNDDRVALVSGFFLLESYAGSYQQQLFDNHVSGAMEGILEKQLKAKPGSVQAGAPDPIVNQTLISEIEQSRPWAKLVGGYGIALPEDYAPAAAATTASTDDARSKAVAALRQWVLDNFKSDVAEQNAIEANKVTFEHAVAAIILANTAK